MAELIIIGIGVAVPLLLGALTRLALVVVVGLGIAYAAAFFAYGWIESEDPRPTNEWTPLLGLIIGAVGFISWIVGTVIGALLRRARQHQA